MACKITQDLKKFGRYTFMRLRTTLALFTALSVSIPVVAAANEASNCSGDFGKILKELRENVNCRAARGLRQHVEASSCEARKDTIRQYAEMFCQRMNAKSQQASGTLQSSVRGTDANRGAQCGNSGIHQKVAGLEDQFQRDVAPPIRATDEVLNQRIPRARKELSDADTALRELTVCLGQAGGDTAKRSACVATHRTPLEQVFSEGAEAAARHSGGFAERIKKTAEEIRQEQEIYKKAHARMKHYAQESAKRASDSRSRVQQVAQGGYACSSAPESAPVPRARPAAANANSAAPGSSAPQSAPIPAPRPASAGLSGAASAPSAASQYSPSAVDTTGSASYDERYPHTWSTPGAPRANEAYNPSTWGGGNLTPTRPAPAAAPQSQQASPPPNSAAQNVIRGIGL